jgi:hypothetical protein
LGQYFVDVNGSNSCEPLDVLEVINQINRTASGSGEGEKRLSPGNEPWNWGVFLAGIRSVLDEEDREIDIRALASGRDRAFAEWTAGE